MEKIKNFDGAIVTLEFDKIREMLAAVCPTEGAKALARALRPSRGIGTVRRMLAETDAAKTMQTTKGMPPFGGVSDIISFVERADKGAVLLPSEILAVGRALSAARGAKDYRNEDHTAETVLDEYFARLVPNKKLEEKISRCIASEDMIADTASDTLYNIRRKMRQENNRIRDSLQKYITSGSYSKFLQEQIVTMRDGRYVIPVKQEYKNEIKGLVHDTSASGATLFVEPLAVVESNNELRLLERKEADEIERILSELSADIAANASALLENYRHLTLLAFIFGKSQLSFKMDAIAPDITAARQMSLVRARHPLISADTVVPITVSLGIDFDTLVITGPNTGGKTVTLKTLGLFAIMAQSGLHIPASDGSIMCIFDDILADIGDEQSIEQSLSTFSSHMVHIVDMLASIENRCLVLFDEVGAGTDPVEGAALAVSILEAVREKKALCAATTHYAELKSYALDTDGVCNASCEFDVNTLRPTYKLIIGAPGKSNAFAISRKLGLPHSIIERAESYVSGENRRFEHVIERLEKERIEMEKAKTEAEMLLAQARSEKAEMDDFVAKREKEADKELEKARATAVRMVESAKLSSDYIFAELEKVKKERESENLAKALDTARRDIKLHLKANSDNLDPVDPKTVEGYELPRPLKKGDEVILVSIGQKGVLVSDPDKSGNVQVQAGVIKTKTNIKNLMLIDGVKVTFTDKNGKKMPAKSAGDRVISAFDPEIDLRGQYGDDACFMLDKYIDDAKRAGVKTLRIIHGKGTGALRKAVTDFLRRDSRVASVRIGSIGEGDTGVSIAELK
ncbi:MAG: endonuclease MutS2 [Clostridia bacterium]|nr:endonuclease MutS2 [Clostridia bacterium]